MGSPCSFVAPTQFRAAKYPLVGYMEADLAVHPREFENLLPFVNESGIAQGSRAIGKEKGRSVSVNKSLVRRIISWCMRIFFEILFKDQVDSIRVPVH